MSTNLLYFGRSDLKVYYIRFYLRASASVLWTIGSDLVYLTLITELFEYEFNKLNLLWNLTKVQNGAYRKWELT